MKIYLDYNSTTPVLPEAAAAMQPYLSNIFGNPSNTHSAGIAAAASIEKAREQIASLIGAKHKEEIIFTGSATESINLAISGVMRSQDNKRRKLLISSVEHAAARGTALALEKSGYELEIIPVNKKGQLDIKALKKQLDNTVALVSLIWANNETGTILKLDEIPELVHSHGALLHLDAVQAMGKITVNIGNIDADLLSISGHKIYGPKGIGALFIKKGIELEPLIYGGGQERNLRSGTQNVSGAIGFGAAAFLAETRIDEYIKHTKELRDRLESGLRSGAKHIQVNGDADSKIPNTLNISIPDKNAEKIALQLNEAGIAVSTGSACSSSKGTSGVLAAMGCSIPEVNGAIRFSVGWDNTAAEIDYTIEKLLELINKQVGSKFTKIIKV
ncbi:MAG: cysteine desulfurase [Lentisphaerae bacterium]|nr:cysteine desulfurase [Lentisphaerota bacterium]MCP4103116.1 cysteine desulfurase [Lentisphaerota bacterium]